MTSPHYDNIEKPNPRNQDAWFSFTCSFCDRKVTELVGAVFKDITGGRQPRIVNEVNLIVCPNCKHGSVYNSKFGISPGSQFGPDIQGLPADIKNAYNEARNCMQVKAFTAAELICRKVIMHVAVEKEAGEGESFAHYLEYLKKEGFMAPAMEKWVDLIRQHGNKSTHELDSPDKDRAESTIMFTAGLLRLIYEMDHMAQKYAPDT